MTDQRPTRGLRERLTTQTEDALGRLAQDLLDNPMISGAITRAFDAREKATQAQEAAMGALNIPSAADIERLTRRLRSVSQRLEGIEDGVDRLERALGALSAEHGVDARLSSIEEQLATLTRLVGDLREGLPELGPPVALAQERLQVEAAETGPPPGDGPRNAPGSASASTPSRRRTAPANPANVPGRSAG